MAAAASRLRDKNRSIEQDRLKRQVEGLDIEAVRAKRRRMADSSKGSTPSLAPAQPFSITGMEWTNITP